MYVNKETLKGGKVIVGLGMDVPEAQTMIGLLEVAQDLLAKIDEPDAAATAVRFISAITKVLER